MKHVYFHIGLHKTGTSHLQGFFLDAEADILAAGIAFPRAGRAPERRIIHSNLAWESLGHGRYDPALGTWEDVLSEIRDGEAQRWIITTEGLSRLRDPGPLLQRFAEFRRTVVVYTRQPVEYLPSRYSEDLKAGSRSDFAAWLDMKGVAMGDHDAIVRPWFHAADALVWRQFRRSRFKSADLVADFFEAFGCDFEGPVEATQIANARASHFESLCLFLWNVVNPRTNTSEEEQIQERRRLREAAHQLAGATRLAAPFDVRTEREYKALRGVLERLGCVGDQPCGPPESCDWGPELEMAEGVVEARYRAVIGTPMPAAVRMKIRRRGEQFMGGGS